MRRAPFLRVVVLLLFAGRASNADDGTKGDPLRLTWTAPAGCPSSDDVRRAVLQSGGAEAASGPMLEADAQVEQRATASGNTWTVHLRTRRGSTTGEREIEAATCNGAAEATAIVLALAFVTPAATPPEETPASVRVPDAPPKANSTRRVIPDDAHAIALGASLTGDASTLPALALGGEVSLAWTPDRLRVELDARRFAPQSRGVAGFESGARFTMTSVGGRGCWAALRTSTLDLAPCVGADARLLSAPGYGADTSYAASAAWAAVAGGALGRLSVASWLALRTRIEAEAPLSRPTFVVENEGFVHKPASVGLAASFGVELLFL
jgi:hypothetical protein